MFQMSKEMYSFGSKTKEMETGLIFSYGGRYEAIYIIHCEFTVQNVYYTNLWPLSLAFHENRQTSEKVIENV